MLVDSAQQTHRALLIERLARAVAARRLETPAVLFLEMNKPLGFLMGQAALVAMPLLGLLAPPADIEACAELLGSREAVEQLIARIEQLAHEPAAERAP
jgi:hypothetical protein